MTIRTKAEFSGIYLTTNGVWPDNINGDISAGDLRNGIQDTWDSIYQDSTRITAADSPYSASDTQRVIFCNTDAGDTTVLLSGAFGSYYKVINCGASGNYLTLSGFSGQKVYGESEQTLADGSVIELHYNTIEGWW